MNSLEFFTSAGDFVENIDTQINYWSESETETANLLVISGLLKADDAKFLPNCSDLEVLQESYAKNGVKVSVNFMLKLAGKQPEIHHVDLSQISIEGCVILQNPLLEVTANVTLTLTKKAFELMRA